MRLVTPQLVLLVDHNVHRCTELAFALGARSEYEIETAHDLATARGFLSHPGLVGVICDEGTDGDIGINLLREIRSTLGIDRIAFVLLSDPKSSGTRVRAWSYEADAILNHPVHAAEAQGCVQVCLNRRALQEEFAAEFTRRGGEADRTQDLLLAALDAIYPGARRRGERLATLGLKLARELHVPDELLDDLVRAARLHEVGRFVVDNARKGSSLPASPAVLAASAALLNPLPALAPAAELIAGMGANWDGSGPLTHLERGAIPLRSRVLRLVADYYMVLDQDALIGAADGTAQACATLSLHSGTRYDAAVLSELALIVSQEDPADMGPSVEPLQVEQLTEGRMLVNDLCTASGVKLLSAGSVLTRASLRLIAERHALDPIVHAIATRKVAS